MLNKYSNFYSFILKMWNMKVHTETVAFKADQKLIEYIERKLSKMDQFFDRILTHR